MTKVWSAQQQAIFQWFEQPTGRGHLVVRARAGTGKTTTIIEGVNRAPEARKLVCAFNKRIADELTTRVTGGTEAKTLHSIGFGMVLRNWEKVGVDKKGDRGWDLTDAVCGGRIPDAMRKLVTKLHTLGREINPYAETGDDLMGLAEQFECEPDEEWRDEYTVEQVCGWAAQAMSLAANKKPAKGIDFADMIFLPVRNGWLRPTHDLVVVDEAQDMTVAQLAIARGICKGRLAVVGDDRQAIYGFRGADSGSLDRLKVELGAEELGLTTTYRCGRMIVDLAAELVPDFQAGPTNPQGRVQGLHTSGLANEAAPGDFILSRLNAPLVGTAMSLLRQGKRTKIAGRDIGKGLILLVGKLSKGARTVPEFLTKVGSWEAKEVARATKAGREAKVEAIIDQAEMLRDLAEGVKNVEEINDRIAALFTDDGLGQAGVITCSSVHRAKGLEAHRVFILKDTLRDTNVEEQNIRYVAITRAKAELVWVGEGCGPATLKKEAA